MAWTGPDEYGTYQVKIFGSILRYSPVAKHWEVLEYINLVQRHATQGLVGRSLTLVSPTGSEGAPLLLCVYACGREFSTLMVDKLIGEMSDMHELDQGLAAICDRGASAVEALAIYRQSA